MRRSEVHVNRDATLQLQYKKLVTNPNLTDFEMYAADAMSLLRGAGDDFSHLGECFKGLSRKKQAVLVGAIAFALLAGAVAASHYVTPSSHIGTGTANAARTTHVLAAKAQFNSNSPAATAPASVSNSTKTYDKPDQAVSSQPISSNVTFDSDVVNAAAANNADHVAKSEWVSEFFYVISADRGAQYHYCPSLSDFAYLRSNTLNKNPNLAHYGFANDVNNFSGGVYGFYVAEEYFSPLNDTPAEFISSLHDAPTHLAGLMDLNNTFFGYNISMGPTFSIHGSNCPTEVSGEGTDMSKLYSRAGCKLTPVYLKRVVFELSPGCYDTKNDVIQFIGHEIL
jgi:hypothetical protein